METHLESVYGPRGGQPEPLSWSQDRRLKFIDFRLRWEGRVNRSDLVEFFNISLPQASLDLSKYTETAPDNLKESLNKWLLRQENWQSKSME